MKKTVMILFICIAVILTACTPMVDNPDGDGDQNTVEITHTVTKTVVQNGENQTARVEVTESFKINPKVVATMTLEIVDIFDVAGLDKTGIQILGLPKSNLPSFLNKYNANEYPNIGTLFELNKDSMDLLMPELIIIGGRSSSLYESLKSDYPYANVLDVSNTNFLLSTQKKVFANLGLIFPNINTTLDTYMTQFESSFNDIKELTVNKEALFLLVNGDDISVFGENSRYGVLYSEFGFTPSDPNVGVTTAHGQNVSYEYVSDINPEIIFLMDRSLAIGSTGATDQVIQNGLIQNTEAGKNNNIYLVDPQSWYILPGGISSTLKMIEDIEQVFHL